MTRHGDTSAATTPSLSEVESLFAQIRPAVQSDGGDIELVGVDGDGVVEVRLGGACIGCPSSHLTLHHFVERRLMEVEGVRGVRAIQ
jgi:Fe-S cluster biogenesis protein NfuA